MEIEGVTSQDKGKAYANIKSVLAAEQRYACYIQLRSQHSVPRDIKMLSPVGRPINNIDAQ